MSASSQTNIHQLAPFRIDPWISERPWGFDDLRPWFDIVAGGAPIGEVWLTGDKSLVATGPHAGKTLEALFAEEHESLLGPEAPSTASPLLIKVIFAREKLSVQVHPDDAMAQKYGDPRGKTECWYALSAEAGAAVALGLKPGTTLAQIEKEIHDGTLESSLNVVPVETGDLIFVDAGTVHAIWPGAVLLETQQNCDITYRMFDYGRPRELHIEKSLEALKFETRAGKINSKAVGRSHRFDRRGLFSRGAGSRFQYPNQREPELAHRKKLSAVFIRCRRLGATRLGGICAVRFGHKIHCLRPRRLAPICA